MRRFYSEDTSESESLCCYDDDHRNNTSSMSSEVDFQCSTSSEISIQDTYNFPCHVNRRTSKRYKNLLRQTSSIDEEISIENGEYRRFFIIEKVCINVPKQYHLIFDSGKQILNLDDGELVLEQENPALKRRASIDGVYHQNKAATLPRGRMKNNKEVCYPIIENYHTYSEKN